MTVRSRRLEVLRAAGLAVFIAVAWCFSHDRLSLRNWAIPLFDRHDALTLLAFEKSAAEGFYIPFFPKFNPYLGAPYSANWNDFPTTDELLVFLGGLLARVLGLFAAANALVLMAHILAGLSFYAVCRVLNYRWEWSLAGSVAFGLSHYAFQRGLHHLGLTDYWHIPLGLLVCWWCGSGSGMEPGSRRFLIGIALAFVTGLKNPYYTNVFLQFLGFAAIAQFRRRSPLRRIATPIVLGVACFLGFLASNVDTIYYSLAHGRNTEGFNRSYRELELYALRPLDLFMPPPGHRLTVASAIGLAYARDEGRKPYIQGEPFAQYLGLAGIGSLMWLGVVTALRIAGPARRPPPIEAVGVLWILLYSVIGGANAFLGQAGLMFFRATNRYSIWILALALLFAVRSLSQLSSSWRAGFVSIAVLGSAAVIAWDQLPPAPTKLAIDTMSARIASDRAFAAAMEKRLAPSAMVFQLPFMSYPESQPIVKMADYEHLRPYLYSSKLHYSYGSVKGRPRDDWQKATAELPVPGMVAALERFGFAAVYINRDGYADRGEALVAALRAAGRPDAIESPNGDLVCVFLRPAVEPDLPSRAEATPVAR